VTLLATVTVEAIELIKYSIEND